MVSSYLRHKAIFMRDAIKKAQSQEQRLEPVQVGEASREIEEGREGEEMIFCIR